jgi:hypothetical protein
MEPAEKLREQARRARYYAQVAAMAEDRAAWRAIAEKWERMADEAERNRQDEE